MKGKKKTRAADIKRRLIDDKDPSPFAGIKLVEKKEPEKPAKPKAVPPLKAKKPSEIVQGYNPSSSFADILYSFEHTGNPYSMPAPKGRNIAEKKTDFGAILDQWEGKGKKKPSKQAQSGSSSGKKSEYRPTRSFADILDSFEGKTPSSSAEHNAPAVISKEQSKAEETVSDTLFRKMDEDDSVSSSVSWTIFGGRNDKFQRSVPEPEPAKEEQPHEKAPLRRSPEYAPSKSFADILSEFEGARKPEVREEAGPVKADNPSAEAVPETSLFRTPQEGEKRAEGVAWSVFGGNSGRPREDRKADDASLPPVVKNSAEHHSAYKGQKPFSSILSEYEGSDNKEKTFEEYIREKEESDDRKRSMLTISKLRTMPPQATLDLHGDTAKEAEEEVRRFLSECSANGLRKISIITGKGLHSEDGVGVLRETVLKVLDDSALVSERANAPLSAGGSGALWIILKA